MGLVNFVQCIIELLGMVKTVFLISVVKDKN